MGTKQIIKSVDTKGEWLREGGGDCRRRLIQVIVSTD
jgi:hypothetical protein